MLDYYGSIQMSPEEIDTILINRFKDSIRKDALQLIITDLRNKDIIHQNLGENTEKVNNDRRIKNEKNQKC